jgi:enoyl-CoA hydratase
MSEQLRYSVDGDVATITIDDGKANAITHDIVDGFGALLDRSTAEAKALVIIGREGRFSAGFDLSVMTKSLADAVELTLKGARLAQRLVMHPQPVVLGITGHALAMGGILTACGDVRVGAAGPFKIGLNEVAIGMPMPAFAIELMQTRLLPNWYTRCLQTAHICSPDEALSAGFLDEVVEPGQVAGRVAAIAAQFAETLDPKAFTVTRRSMRTELQQRLEAAIATDGQSFTGPHG